MRTRISQEEANEFLKALPEEISLQTYQLFQRKSLHLKVAPEGLKFTFTEEALQGTYHLEKFKLAFFYKGQETKKRVPLGAGSMALWTTIYHFMANVEMEIPYTYQTPPFDISTIRYIGTEDESEGVSSISSNVEMPYRLTHTFLTPEKGVVLFIEDCYNNERKYSCLYNQGTVKLNYLEEDKLMKQAMWGQAMESRLAKALQDERDLYHSLYDVDDGEFA